MATGTEQGRKRETLASWFRSNRHRARSRQRRRDRVLSGVEALERRQLLAAYRDLAGFRAGVLARNDDGSTGQLALPFSANFFGVTFNRVYVNNNGNITFDAALSTFTPFDLTSTNRQIIAPF